MKRIIPILLLAHLLSGTIVAQTTDYVMLTPLDTTTLPRIAKHDVGGQMVRKVLNGDALWEKSHKKLVRENFSYKAVYKLFKRLYDYTHTHYAQINCTYWSQDPQGDSLLVSGRIYLPKGRILKGIVVANHYTIGSNAEAPSNMFAMESMFTMKDYAVVMADYVGYGVSRDEVHPYLHWRSAAQTSIDLLNCMPALLDYYGYTYPTDVVVQGYSQGGSVALGVARMLEEESPMQFSQDSLTPSWTVRHLYAGAGPYDPAATYDYCVQKDTMGIPAAIPLIVMGLGDAYELNFQVEDFFLEPLLSHYDEWVLSKNYAVQQINQHMGSVVMSELMTAQALDRNNPQTQQLYRVLAANSNVGYDLQAPAYFLHSLDDEVVPLINTTNLQRKMPYNTNKIYDIGHYSSHMEASIPFMKYVYQDL